MSRSATEIRDANVRYHDIAASKYDAKWGIDFGAIGQDQVLAKVRKALGHSPDQFGRSLEIGAGTGYFTINLVRAGMIREATTTDISPGMLRALRKNAADAGIVVKTVACEAESLPFEDASFDLVLGHAILHHIPDLDRAFTEFERVLVPGGTVLFCGEPSSAGDRLATAPKAVGTWLGPIWRKLLRAPERSNGKVSANDEAAREEMLKSTEEGWLEGLVDVHAFEPATLRSAAAKAGLTNVRVTGEELLANIFGWLARTLEAGAEPASIPYAWRRFAFRSYLTLQKVDSALLEKRLPASIFYNLLLSASKPG